MSIYPINHLLWLPVNVGGGWNCTVQRSSPHKCGQRSCYSAFNAVAAIFTSRYFCILIIFACTWSSSLSLDLLGGSPRLPKYLLDRYSLYPRSIDSSDYIPSYFLYVIIHWASPTHLLLLGRIQVLEYGPRPIIPIWVLTFTITPQNFNFSLASEEKK